MNGGGNISASPDAPQKWVSIPEYEKTIDLEHGRMRVRQRNHQNFVFAGLAGYLGAANPGGGAARRRCRLQPRGQRPRGASRATRPSRARRFDMLNNPVVLVRAALDASARVTNVRAERTLQLADITVATGETLTLAIDGTSGLPAWVRWMAHDENLGDVTFRTSFTGYLPVKGVMLPMGYNTRHRLPRRRAEQAVRGQERGGRTDRRSGRARRCAIGGARGRAVAECRGDARGAGRLAPAREWRRELDSVRVRRSPDDVRGAVEPGVDQGADRSRARDRARQAADRARGVAPPLRSHRRHPAGHGRGADDHRAQGHRRAVPGDRAADRNDRARCARVPLRGR